MEKKKVRFIIRISFILLSLVALFGCGQRVDKNEILIGAYLSLTGTTATFGTSTLHGVEMAVDEVNAAGGVLGKKIRLITADTQSKPEEAALAVAKLITRDNVCALLGEIASSRSLAAAPIAQENKIPMVSPGSTNPEVTRKGDYIFRVCYIDPFQGEVIAKFAYESLGLRRVAVIKDTVIFLSLPQAVLPDLSAAARFLQGAIAVVVDAVAEFFCAGVN
jgi:branched-chain amino acid transport system substrate-binding protein